jgi:hypothetical protein
VLSDGFSVRLWSFPMPAVADASTPVIELLRGGVHVAWWHGRLGFGWSATLTCLPTPADPNCIVTSALGAHAGSAEVILLHNSALVSPPQASVAFDSSEPRASDLDGDGRLDVLGMENDYRPDFAHGHNYWATYRGTASSLQRTGCQPVQAGVTAPGRLLSGPCPVVPQG